MKPSTLFLGLLICVAAVVSYVVYRNQRGPWRQLESFVGRDLSLLEKKDVERLEKLLAKVIPSRKSTSPGWGYQPCAIWRFEASNGPVHWVLIEVNRTNIHPGSDEIRLHTLNEETHSITVTEFTTGHRRYIAGFDLKTLPLSETPALEIRTDAGSNPSRQFYALVGEDWRLIRMERGDGAIARPQYDIKHFRCGPELHPPDLLAVEQALGSPNPSEQLATLVWLTGFHKPPAPSEVSPQYQTAADVVFVNQARAHPSVRARLEALSKSPEPWIAESAALALQLQPNR